MLPKWSHSTLTLPWMCSASLEKEPNSFRMRMTVGKFKFKSFMFKTESCYLRINESERAKIQLQQDTSDSDGLTSSSTGS